MSKSSKEVEKNWKLKNGASGNSRGRPKGSKNKFTSLKDSFLEAFEALDGTQGLINWAKKSERNKALFYGWITKMLPSNVDVDHSGTIKTDNKVTVEVVHVQSKKNGKKKKDEANDK